MTIIQPSHFEVSLPFPRPAAGERSARRPAPITVEPEKSLWRVAKAEDHRTGALLVDLALSISSVGVLIIAILQALRIL